jgi:transcriptional regulator with XRE-family HTH domain
MVIGDRLRTLREEKKISQGEIEKRTGLLRCYISRVECGHTVPAVETLEKFARALELPLYQLMYDGDQPPVTPKITVSDAKLYGSSGRQQREVMKLRKLLGQMKDRDRDVLLTVAQKLAK